MKNNRNVLLRRVLAFAMCLALALPGVTVEAGTSTKSKAERPVKQFYKYAKKMDIGKMSKYVEHKSEISDGFGFSSKQEKELVNIVKNQNKKKFSYKIVKTTLSSNKKSATIKVKVTYRSLYKAGYYAAQDCWELEEGYYYDHGKNPSSSKKGRWFIRSLKSWMNKYAAKSKTKIITIKTKKHSSGWKICEVSDDMKNSYTCALTSAMLDGVD